MSEHKNKRPTRWFRAKEYGWGWFPVTWQGWLVTVAFALLFTLTFLVFFGWIGSATEAGVEARDLAFGVLEFLLAIGLLSYILYRICVRFGEKPGWRWGKR